MDILSWMVGGSGILGIVGGVATALYNRVQRNKPHGPQNSRKRIQQRYGELISKVKPYYDANNRFYHNWDHIQQGLDFIAEYEDQLFGDRLSKSNIERLVLAWIFHDVVYNINNTDNEYQSGLLALDTLCFNYKKFDFIGIDKIIETTKDHKIKVAGQVSEVLCDLDLIRLGCEWDQFMDYTDQVYLEYKNAVPDKTLFMKARAQFFQKMLADRSFIFKTQLFQDKYEESAQRNLRKFITTYIN